MGRRAFFDGNQSSSWLPVDKEAGYRFRGPSMRNTGDGMCPVKRSNVLWTSSRRQKIPQFWHRREKGRGKCNLQHSFRLHAPLTAPRFTTLKSKTIHVSMAEGCTYAATAPSPQAATLLPGSGSISPGEKPFQSCGC